MQWNNPIISSFAWGGAISNREAKEKIAETLAQKVHDGDVIGVGSGSTSYLALFAIAKRMRSEHLTLTAIPTSRELALTCTQLGIATTSLFESRPDWYFDGADEVDPEYGLVKGRGGAMYQEKLIMRSSPKTYILVDSSKQVAHLGEKYPIPVEIYPDALHSVTLGLTSLGAREIVLRMARGKDGPIITESGGFILDVRFALIPPGLEREIKCLTGVIESGLFQGYDVEIILP